MVTEPEALVEKVGQVVIQRTSAKDIKMRDLYVYVDGEEDTLLFDEILEYELPVGDHRVKISNRLYSKSEDFSLSEGEVVKFTVANIPMKGLFTLLTNIGGTGAYKVLIERK